MAEQTFKSFHGFQNILWLTVTCSFSAGGISRYCRYSDTARSFSCEGVKRGRRDQRGRDARGRIERTVGGGGGRARGGEGGGTGGGARSSWQSQHSESQFSVNHRNQ